MKTRYLFTAILILPLFFSCQKSSSDDADPNESTNTTKTWQITENLLQVNGRAFEVSEKDMSITGATESAFLLVGGDQFNNVKDQGERLSLYNISNNIPFQAGLVLDSNIFRNKIFSLQYDGMDILGQPLPPQFAGGNFGILPQGRVVVSEMNTDGQNGFGFSVIEFDFDKIIVSNAGPGQGTMTQGTNTLSTLIDGTLRIEYK